MCIPETVPEHGMIMSLLSVSLPSLRGTFTSPLEVEALLDLFTLRPYKDLGTLGVGEMSLSKSPVRGGNGMETSLLSSSDVGTLCGFIFNKSSSELNSEPSVSKPFLSALNNESNAVLGLDFDCKCRLLNACTALD